MLSAVGYLTNVVPFVDTSLLSPKFCPRTRVTETRASILGFDGS